MRKGEFRLDMSIEERFLKVLRKTMEAREQDIKADTDLSKLGFNSISYIKLVVAVEEEFNIEFNDEYLDIGKFDGIKSVISYIESKIMALDTENV